MAPLELNGGTFWQIQSDMNCDAKPFHFLIHNGLDGISRKLITLLPSLCKQMAVNPRKSKQ